MTILCIFSLLLVSIKTRNTFASKLHWRKKKTQTLISRHQKSSETATLFKINLAVKTYLRFDSEPSANAFCCFQSWSTISHQYLNKVQKAHSPSLRCQQSQGPQLFLPLNKIWPWLCWYALHFSCYPPAIRHKITERTVDIWLLWLKSFWKGLDKL